MPVSVDGVDSVERARLLHTYRDLYRLSIRTSRWRSSAPAAGTKDRDLLPDVQGCAGCRQRIVVVFRSR
jgi:hypothetical protein